MSYLALTFYDVLALRIAGRPLPYRMAALASFTSYTLSHNLGVALLTGGSARYRIYNVAGLGAQDIARVIANASLAFWAGLFTLAGAALALSGSGAPRGGLSITIPLQHAVGGTIALFVMLLMFARPTHMRHVRFFGWTLPLASRPQALAQLVIAAVDLMTASAALLVLVPGVAIAAFPGFFLAYALAIIAALISHVPGGVGVFETVLVVALPDMDPPSLFAALIAYRAIYYLLPFGLGAALLAMHERQQWRRPVAKALAGTEIVAAAVAPILLASLVFIGGVVLLVSGSLPGEPDRLHWLHSFVPLPFIETSHIAASLVGTALLFLAPGLYRRLDGAFIATRVLMLAGAIFSLAKGFDYEEATVLLAITVLLQWTRPAFYRRTALTVEPLTTGWIVSITIALGLTLWIGFFSYKHVAYRDVLWWRFALSGDASRFLRASFAIAVLLAGGAIWRLFAPARAIADRQPPCPGLIERALHESDRSDAMLALTGDKRFIVSKTEACFLMYQRQGRSWIVMGDPVGPRRAWHDLLWAIREQADAAQGRLLLYQISQAALPMAIDLGLELVKYGEEARIDLTRFSLDGATRRNLRHSERRCEREGATFEIVPAAAVPPLLEELRVVSDEWLRSKGHGEKAFSLGQFEPDYLTRFDCAVVRVEKRAVAFANIWVTDNHSELSVDLMRHRDITPTGTMDYLFVHLMHWGRARGFQWFNMGLAPLSGLETRRLTSFWARVGALLYRHGESLYGFEGLRAYKDKYGPIWQPRYVAGPKGLGLARALIDLQRLIGGGKGSAATRTLARFHETSVRGSGYQN